MSRAEISQAEPSQAEKVPSQAKLGHFNFQTETELDFFLNQSLFILRTKLRDPQFTQNHDHFQS